MPDPSPQERLVRPATAAQMLGTSHTTVLCWLRDGRLPGFKVGRGWRVRVSDLEALMAEQIHIPART